MSSALALQTQPRGRPHAHGWLVAGCRRQTEARHVAVDRFVFLNCSLIPNDVRRLWRKKETVTPSRHTVRRPRAKLRSASRSAASKSSG